MKYFLNLLLLAALGSPARLWAQAPTPPGFERSPSGTEYKLFRRNAAGHYAPRPLAPAGDAPYANRVGQLLLVYIQYRTDRDSVLMDTRQMQSDPVPVPLGPTPPQRRPGGSRGPSAARR